MASDKAGDNVLVRVENLKKYFPIMQGLLFSRQVGCCESSG